MPYNPDKHHRHSLRLNGYDYISTGAYFITICTHHRECLFGEIIDSEMKLNEWGEIVSDVWQWLSARYDPVELDEWVIMPNHLHGILVLTDTFGMGDRTGGDNSTPGIDDYTGRGCSRTAPTTRRTTSTTCRTAPAAEFQNPKNIKRKSVDRLIGAFKTVSTKRINILRGASGTPVWQRNFYDHIIRNETAMQHIRYYIQTNPSLWQSDQLHPDIPSKW